MHAILKKLDNRYSVVLISILLGIYLTIVFTLDYGFYLEQAFEVPSTRFGSYFWAIRQQLDGFGIEKALTSVGVAVLVYNSLTRVRRFSKRSRIVLVVISACFGLLNSAVLFVYYRNDLTMFASPYWFFMWLFLAGGWAVFFYFSASWFFTLIERGLSASSIQSLDSRRYFLRCFLVIILCWLPWILIYYPASMDNDVFRQLGEYFRVGNSIPTNHHPWFSTCVIGVFVQIGYFLGNAEFGVFLYVLLRDLVMASIFAACALEWRRWTSNKVANGLVLAFFAIVPIWGAYAKHAWKDTFGIALFVLVVLLTYRLIQEIRSDSVRLSSCIGLGVACLFACLFRSNFIFALLLPMLLVEIALIRKREFVCAMVLVCSLGAYFGYVNVLLPAQGIMPAQEGEALSVPFQMTARAVQEHEDSLSAEERAELQRYFPVNEIAESYDPVVSDNVKSRWRHESIAGYFGLWAKMGLEYPRSYLAAFFSQSGSYYAFTPRYPDHAGNLNSGISVFSWIGDDGQVAEFFGFSYPSFTKGLREALNAWVYTWDRIPLLSLTVTPAFYTWITLLCLFWAIRRKDRGTLVICLMLLLMALTCIGSPVNDCFRYYAPVAASMPVLLLLVFQDAQNGQPKDSQSLQKRAV